VIVKELLMKKTLLIFIFLTVVSIGSVQTQELLKMDNIPDETFLKPVETALLSYQSAVSYTHLRAHET